MLPSRSSRLLAATLVLLAAVPASPQADPPSPLPVPDGPPAELGSTLLAGVRAALAVPPSGGLQALHPLDVFDLQACLRGWTPCAAPLVATAISPVPGAGVAPPRLLVSPDGSRLVFGAAALAVAADGGGVAAWEAGPSCDLRTGTCRAADGDGTAVYIRQLRPGGTSGSRLGPLLRIHAAAAGDQARPAAAAGPGGAFVVLWQSRGQDGSGWGVYGRRFGPGSGLGEEVRIAPGTLGDQQAPAVALAADGGFLAAWQGELGGTAGQGIFVRSFDGADRPRGRGARIDSGGAAPAADPALAAVPGGTFVIAWRSQAGAGTWHLFARRLGPSGRPLGPPLRLTPEPVPAASPPSVAADETGGFLVAWSAAPTGASIATSGHPRQVAASYLDAADRPLAGGALAPRPGQDQHDPAVASDGRRSYGVVWSVSTVIRRAPATSYSALRLALPPG